MTNLVSNKKLEKKELKFNNHAITKEKKIETKKEEIKKVEVPKEEPKVEETTTIKVVRRRTNKKKVTVNIKKVEAIINKNELNTQKTLDNLKPIEEKEQETNQPVIKKEKKSLFKLIKFNKKEKVPKEKKPKKIPFRRLTKKKINIDAEREKLEQNLQNREFVEIQKESFKNYKDHELKKKRKRYYFAEAAVIALIVLVIDIMLFVIYDINYVHLFDVDWLNILITVILMGDMNVGKMKNGQLIA